ncbi:MAG: serine/threonine-protein kinase [Anaerolineae bacterium]|nr:serine/threonine-protein kinase [Anaerolineae bacterium]
MTLCPRCGTANRIGARFCRVCRTELPATVCPHCGEPLRSGARFCRRCGQPVPEASRAAAPEACPRCGRTVRAGARFCPGCGASLSEAVAVSCPHCRTPLRPGARFCARCGTPVAAPAVPPSRICPRCGAPARPSARFCGRCSQPLAVPSPVSPPPSPSAAPILPGTDGLLPLTTLAGRYVILEKVGEGGMAIVYKAQDKKGNQIVAIKEMSESAIRQKNPDEWERVLEAFEREARFLATLSHPNLVRVSDAFREGERRYMVMEFVAGRTLEAMLEEQLEPFPEDRVLVWAAQLCDVLAYLHSQTPKIIYRDLKPGNVMVLEETDQVKLLDMGIARTYKPGKQQDTIHLGTPGYAPPEQYGKGQTDERSDVYALGALLHHLLSLRDPAQKPFDFPPLQTLNPKVSQRVADAVARAVEKERSKRFPSVQEMKAALLGEEETVLKPAKPRAKKKPAPPAKKPPPLKILPPELDWNVVVRGTPAPPMSLTVLHPAGAKVTATSPVPWLEAEVVPVDDETTEVTVRLNTSLLPLGQRSPQTRAVSSPGSVGILPSSSLNPGISPSPLP